MGRIQYHQQTGLKKMFCCWAFKHMHQLFLLCMLNSKLKLILISVIFNSLTNSFHVSKDFHPSSFQKKWKQIITEATTFFPTQPNAILSLALEGVILAHNYAKSPHS